MNEMYAAALNLLRIVEYYDTDGTPAEQAVATELILEYRLPWMVSPFLSDKARGSS